MDLSKNPVGLQIPQNALGFAFLRRNTNSRIFSLCRIRVTKDRALRDIAFTVIGKAISPRGKNPESQNSEKSKHA
jgi:hypothetical protein